jgi:hypothetical protein
VANLQQKSAQYMSGYGAKFACMLLCEASLGKQFLIHEDGEYARSLKRAPDGCDSVHAVGRYQPPSWKVVRIDGKDVRVPESASVASGVESTFAHDEFVLCDEAEVRIRYVLTVKFY